MQERETRKPQGQTTNILPALALNRGLSRIPSAGREC